MADLGKQHNFKLTKLGKPALRVLYLFSKSTLVVTAEALDVLLGAFEYKSVGEAMHPSRVRIITQTLERTGLIKGSSQGGFSLTSKGSWELARHRLLDMPENHMVSKWDHKWRVIVFDIPELERRQRDMLRRAISGYGMYRLQQSVWVYPYPCDYFINSIKNDLGFQSEVLMMLVEKIENQRELEREFGLM